MIGFAKGVSEKILGKLSVGIDEIGSWFKQYEIDSI
jgi:hypothetical protein